MKPTDKQIKVIDTILSIIKTWKNSNDIDSPTHTVDIHDFLYADLESEDIIKDYTTYALEKLLTTLIYEIQTI
jgi:predicted nuclease of restriction endonuclease-like RecB superfamily